MGAWLELSDKGWGGQRGVANDSTECFEEHPGMILLLQIPTPLNPKT